MSSMSRAWRVPSGGSPGHHSVTGRSWTRSGATIAATWRPASPPATRSMNSAHVSAASARGSTQCAWTWASSHDGPSGSALDTIIVRDGWRPVSMRMIAAAFAPISGWRAITTRLSTLVRAATRRSSRPSSSVCTVSGVAGPDLGQLGLDPGERCWSATTSGGPAGRRRRRRPKRPVSPSRHQASAGLRAAASDARRARCRASAASGPHVPAA